MLLKLLPTVCDTSPTFKQHWFIFTLASPRECGPRCAFRVLLSQGEGLWQPLASCFYMVLFTCIVEPAISRHCSALVSSQPPLSFPKMAFCIQMTLMQPPALKGHFCIARVAADNRWYIQAPCTDVCNMVKILSTMICVYN